MRFLQIFFILLLVAHPCVAQERKKMQRKVEWVQVVRAKKHSISPNIVFLIDASSSIDKSSNLTAKFNKAWNRITSLLGHDELYFCIYIFHDKNDDRFRPWTNVFGPNKKNEFKEAYRWIKNNTGMYSYGQIAIRKALRERNPLNKNPTMKDTLTIIFITDGGLTEAAEYAQRQCLTIDEEEERAYYSLYDEIKSGQAWRQKNGLPTATICCIGLENKEVWSLSVKRPDWECQRFLNVVGKKNYGGYFLVRNKRQKKEKK